MVHDAIILEIKNQIEQCDVRLAKEIYVSDYVKILSEKRQYEELLKRELTKSENE